MLGDRMVRGGLFGDRLLGDSMIQDVGNLDELPINILRM